jgi:hypothetical protein
VFQTFLLMLSLVVLLPISRGSPAIKCFSSNSVPRCGWELSCTMLADTSWASGGWQGCWKNVSEVEGWRGREKPRGGRGEFWRSRVAVEKSGIISDVQMVTRGGDVDVDSGTTILGRC